MAQPIPYNSPVATTFPVTPSIPARRFNVNRFNQIVRFGIQLSGTNFSTQAALMLKSNWDTLLAATDATRMILSPPFSGSKISASKPLITNTDTNATYRGEPIYFGEGTAEFSANFTDVDAAVIDAFFTVVSPFTMSLQGAVANSAVWYLVNNDGMIFSTPTWGGLPIIALSPRTRMTDGLNSSDIVGFTAYLPPNWDGGTTLPTPSSPVGTAGGVDLRTYAW